MIRTKRKREKKKYFNESNNSHSIIKVDSDLGGGG